MYDLLAVKRILAVKSGRFGRPVAHLVLTLGLLLATLLQPAIAAQDEGTLTIGSKRFTESYVLAEILAQTVAPQLQRRPQIKQGLGNTAIVYEALRSGAIDLYPEYTGTIANELLKLSGTDSLTAINEGLAPLGLAAAVPLGFNDGYALAMRAADAKARGVRNLSDLARHPELKLGLSNEFIGRADGWRGLKDRYRLPQQPIGLDHGLAYDAVGNKQVDVIDIYTTDAKIDRLGLTVLKDDLTYFPRYDAVVLYRADVPRRFPNAWAALQQKLQGRIDEASMIAMNARAELDGVAFDVIARDWLAKAAAPSVVAASGVGATGVASTVAAASIADAASFAAGTAVGVGAGRTALAAAAASPDPSARGFWGKLFGPDLARLTWQHLMLVVVSVGIAALIAIPLGIAVFRHPRTRAVVVGATGLLQTVPSLALLAVLIWLLSAIGTLPALVALTLYSLLPILRNTTTGLATVPAGLVMAAKALGLTQRQSMQEIQLPLALPTVIAGVRTATSIAIGTATIAAFIGAGGYGERIVTGLALNDGQLLLAGALPAALLALLSEAVFELVERTLVWQPAR
ncbi:MAG: glycine betaine ABC transporter substrate-binding protein [Burkholderiaceae bacterium]